MSNNNYWFSIEAKDGSRRGYWSGKDEIDACERFGLKPEECYVKKVIWNGEEFVDTDQLEQGRLL